MSYSIDQVTKSTGVTKSRAATIARALFDELPESFTDDQQAQVAAVAKYMTEHKVTSVSKAVEAMGADQGSSGTAPANGDINGFLQVMEKRADDLSTRLADGFSAAVVLRTMAKIGIGGELTQAAMANFTQATTIDFGLTEDGQLLMGGSPVEARLLAGSLTD